MAGNRGPWNTPSKKRHMNKSGIIKANEKPPITIKPEIIVITVQPSVHRTSVLLGPIFSESKPPGN